MRFFFNISRNQMKPQTVLVLIQSGQKSLNCRHFSAFSTAPSIENSPKKFSRHEALKHYGLSHLGLTWPDKTTDSRPVDYIKKNPKSIRQMYGESDLSQLPIFQGGFINFGYWSNTVLNQDKISTEERIVASQAMYKVVGDLAGIMKQHNLLDIGCGLGYGSAFFSEQYQPRLVVGLDISPDQIARAKKHHISGVESARLRFTLGEAESMPFTDHSFDAILSVEAAQHFVSIPAFSNEVSRVLKPGGKLVVTSFFPCSQEGVDALNAIIPNYHIHGSQNTIPTIQTELAKRMKNVKVTSIGKNVWHGFSKWLDQIGYQHQWSKIWCALYEKGLIDYVVYEATQPGLSVRPPLSPNMRGSRLP